MLTVLAGIPVFERDHHAAQKRVELLLLALGQRLGNQRLFLRLDAHRLLVLAPLVRSTRRASSPALRRYGLPAQRSAVSTCQSLRLRSSWSSVSSCIRLMRRLMPPMRSTIPSTARSRSDGRSALISSRKLSTWSRSPLFLCLLTGKVFIKFLLTSR